MQSGEGRVGGQTLALAGTNARKKEASGIKEVYKLTQLQNSKNNKIYVSSLLIDHPNFLNVKYIVN